jgi:hypothetical protein
MGVDLTVLIAEEIDDDVEEQKDDRVAHIVGPEYTDKGVIQGRTIVMNAMIYGTEVTALCGYKWIPSRNPENFPVCKKCKAISERASD